LRVPEAHG